MNLFNHIDGAGAVRIGLLITGCAAFYSVTEPTSGRVCHPEDGDHNVGSSASGTDSVTGSAVTIQIAEFKEISEDEFDDGPAAANMKPAQEAAPAPSSSALAPAVRAPAVESSSTAPAEESK
jgi:hypothetical protein